MNAEEERRRSERNMMKQKDNDTRRIVCEIKRRADGSDTERKGVWSGWTGKAQGARTKLTMVG